MSHHTVTKIVTKLIDRGLAEQREQLVYALEPQEGQQEWFAWKPGEGPWFKRLATYREYYLCQDAPIKESTNAVLWWFHSFAQEGVVPRLKRQAITGIASNLGMEQRTVARAIKELEWTRLVRRWGKFEFVLEKPALEQLAWWREARPKVRLGDIRVYQFVISKVPEGARADAERINGYFLHWTDRMIEAGYPAHEVWNYWKTDVVVDGMTLNHLMTLFCYTGLFADAFEQAEAQHRKTGKYVPHSLHLLKSLTPSIIKQAIDWDAA